MKKPITQLFFIGIIIVFPIAVISKSLARPYPPRSAVCYYFNNRNLQYIRPCVVSAGYGAGGHYAVLTWTNGHETPIEKINFCPQNKYDPYGFCSYNVYDKPAKRLSLDSFLKMSEQTPNSEDKVAECYELSSGEAFCFGLQK